MRIRTVCLIAARELRDARRSRWLWLASACFFALSLALSWLGLAGSGRSGLAGFDRTTASLLNLAILFVPLVTLPIGGLSVAAELEDGSLAQLLSHPVSRAEVWLGKWLGLFAAVTFTFLVGFGLSGIVVAIASGGGRAGIFVSLVGLLILYAAATLSLGVLLSAMLKSRAKAIGATFGIWLAMIYLGDLGTIGVTIMRSLGPAQVFLLALFNPAQQVRISGTLLLADSLDVLGPAGIFGFDLLGRQGLLAVLVATLLALSAFALGVGYGVFRKAVVT